MRARDRGQIHYPHSIGTRPIPSGGVYAGIIRHMRAARDGSLLIHQSSTNRIIQVTVQGRTASR